MLEILVVFLNFLKLNETVFLLTNIIILLIYHRIIFLKVFYFVCPVKVGLYSKIILVCVEEYVEYS